MDNMDEKEIFDLYLSDDEYLKHYGIKRRSGRYPWGSGDQPFQRSGDFLARYEELKKSGMSEVDIATAMDVTSTKLRVLLSIARSERKSDLRDRALSLEKDGLNRVEIAETLGLKGESSVRSLLNSDSIARTKIAENTANMLRDVVDKKGMVDVGVGVARQVGVTPEKFEQAIQMLVSEGYELHTGRVPQATNKGKHTTLKVLAVPGTPHKEMFNYEKIGTVQDFISYDGGDTFKKGFVYPKSLDSNRLEVRYAEDGGAKKDGIIELRRGVDDLSLGNSNYSQVRILVDDTHYIKGMAVYADDLPEGIDIRFNTNKTKETAKIDTLKKIKNDPENPFGSAIKEHGGQSYYLDKDGNEQLSLINKRSDEGDWGEWSKELSSQFLSKQPMSLIKKQIDISIKDKQDELKEIESLTNPTVKKELLKSFADDLDSASIHLKAASLPGVQYKVIIAVNSLKDNEIYAPHLEDGSRVALVRYPHAGIFEIPVLTVNNRNKESINMLTNNPSDAVGINYKVAEILSGADFDGDTVMTIPLTNEVRISARPPLEDLKGFDGKMKYGPDSPEPIIIKGQEIYTRGDKTYKAMNEGLIQKQMGSISNLITDMTLHGAEDDEIARAVKHSMVVIDAYKHKLDYKQSEIDNGIDALKTKYQRRVDENGKVRGGAATLISRAKGETIINERKEGAFVSKDTGRILTMVTLDSGKKVYIDELTGVTYDEHEKKVLYIDPKTGEKLYHETGRTYEKYKYKDSKGKTVEASVIRKDGKMLYKDESGMYVEIPKEATIISKPATISITNMEATKDARTLSSGTPQENLYANYANTLKYMANEARKQYLITKDIVYSPLAKETYSDEVKSLTYKVNQSLLNAPKERHAQTVAAANIRAKLKANPTMTDEQEKKLKQQELIKARNKIGASRVEVVITAKEWEAIQAGAISASKLKELLKVADMDTLRKYAMPKDSVELSAVKIQRIQNMLNAGYTTSDIAKSLGVSSSTIHKYSKGDN